MGAAERGRKREPERSGFLCGKERAAGSRPCKRARAVLLRAGGPRRIYHQCERGHERLERHAGRVGCAGGIRAYQHRTRMGAAERGRQREPERSGFLCGKERAAGSRPCKRARAVLLRAGGPRRIYHQCERGHERLERHAGRVGCAGGIRAYQHRTRMGAAERGRQREPERSGFLCGKERAAGSRPCERARAVLLRAGGPRRIYHQRERGHERLERRAGYVCCAGGIRAYQHRGRMGAAERGRQREPERSGFLCGKERAAGSRPCKRARAVLLRAGGPRRIYHQCERGHERLERHAGRVGCAGGIRAYQHRTRMGAAERGWQREPERSGFLCGKGAGAGA